jgi:Domain of unknown function (DUF3846)
MKLALHIPASGTPTAVRIGDNELGALQELVGGWIEYVPTEQPVTLYCNEEGKIEGLPLNELATQLFGQLLMPGDYLAGDIVALGPLDDEGESTSVSEDMLAYAGVTP